MWWYACDSVIGASHLRSAKPCQDSFRIAFVGAEGGLVVAAISDGASSVTQAEVGSKIVCESLVSFAIASLLGCPLAEIEDATVAHWFRRTYSALERQAQMINASVMEFSATGLLVAACERLALCAQVGDGAIIVRSSGSEAIHSSCWPHSARSSDQSSFVSNPLVADRVSINRFENPADIVMLSDGLEPLALDAVTRELHRDSAVSLLDIARNTIVGSTQTLKEALANYLRSEFVESQTDDDKTLFVTCWQ